MSGGHQAESRREGIPLGRIAGVPIVLAYSWFIVAAFTVVVYGPTLANRQPQLGAAAYFVAFAYAVLLLLSVLVHELAHALTARAFGWPSQKIVLNLWGGHTQFEAFTASPGRSVLVALAGPAANFVLAAAAWLVVSGVTLTGVADILVNIFMWANFLIAVFNVLPGLPLDGGRIVESAVWRATGSQEKGTIAAGWTGRAIVVGIVVLTVALPVARGQELDLPFTMITLLVAAFLWQGATASIRHAGFRSRLPGVVAGQLARPAVGVPNFATVEEAVRAGAEAGIAVVLCSPDGKPQGVVDPSAVSRVPEAARSTTPVTAVGYALAPGAYVPETAAGQELVQYLAQLAGTEYAVVDGSGRVVGLLSQRDVVSVISGRPVRPAR
ncbi:peptidase M50 [Sinomonas cellulolyticus]|uniref:Zinc metalloprotease n=1 Tax=Sinomonas cellulolyticus TaxID=2801916 RepID=A0ABS1K0S8_9MICC|nr:MULTISPECIES: site-2 protease family protein [Sinomonas]MBL0705285.1 site-2 protease family protein [Sinomonas cellulolyticus]GHG40323.1 peptidase M50 [Sinomonas sp. KCTC 49339]